MLRRIILKKLTLEEKKLGESIDYVRHIVQTSLSCFFRFAKIFSIASYQKRLPLAAKHVAQLVASRDEDCGTCVQIGLNLAKADGVDPEVLRAVIDERPEDLPEPLAAVYRFAESVVGATPDSESLRCIILGHYGDEGLVELALSMASSRFFPIVKRSLGYATSCSSVEWRL